MAYYSDAPKQANRECFCNDLTVLILERKVAVRAVAVLIFIGFFIFLAGYFLGKKHVAQKYLSKIEQEAFADQVNVALNKFFDASKPSTELADTAEEAMPLASDSSSSSVMPETCTAPLALAQVEKPSTMKYQGQLLGGSQKVVRSFADRLAKKGIEIEVKRRVGKTSRGKNIVWYQAVTPVFSTKKDLDMLIVAIQKTEKIDDINIVELV